MYIKSFLLALLVVSFGSCKAQKILVKHSGSTNGKPVAFSCPECDTVVYKTTKSGRVFAQVRIQTNLPASKTYILDALSDQGRYSFTLGESPDLVQIGFHVERKDIFVRLSGRKNELQLEERIKATVYLPETTMTANK